MGVSPCKVFREFIATEAGIKLRLKLQLEKETAEILPPLRGCVDSSQVADCERMSLVQEALKSL
jgi:hypothetical protein